jgi:transcriptional regulator with XRE-family HTH domain
MATVTQKLGVKIRKIRKQKGLTQEKLAELANLDYSYLNMIEAGKKNPSIKKLAKIAKALGVSLQKLMP